ncbi:P-loop containing nucleoside triphosphate hydrolase protein [Ilyonectria robusta]|uniref:P-loop containing nucleoside triphosphate hydrolase protein n=1 Tax=Ilyonectria robusta TaxID=1079257 RepID=UPI001E8CCE8F|nr:P-loop containing nucleoside triphosphate hydrolase protein [Ilyonectria robusta]KAH8667124.1 P-loop containing nucleoside triphosphate hydrolase protein [Ilyonectria robusta]
MDCEASWAETTTRLGGQASLRSVHFAEPTSENGVTAAESPVEDRRLIHIPRVLAKYHQKRFGHLLSTQAPSFSSSPGILPYAGPGLGQDAAYGSQPPSGVVYLDGNWVELSPDSHMPQLRPSESWHWGSCQPPFQRPHQNNPPPWDPTATATATTPWSHGPPVRGPPPGRRPTNWGTWGAPGRAPLGGVVTNVQAGSDSDSDSESSIKAPPHNPFEDTSDSDDSDGSSSTSSGSSSGNSHTRPSRPNMHLLPRKLEDTSDSEAASPVEKEWERQKREFNLKFKSLDQLMSLVGVEEAKAEFLKVKATVEAARQRKGRLRRQGLNLALMGNPGTGKKALAALYGILLSECNVWPNIENGKVHTKVISGSSLDVDELNRMFGRHGSGVFLFIDDIDSVEQNDYKQLLDVLDSHASKAVVVLAGSADSMTELLGSHPQGRWHFCRRIQLKDYTDEQLRLIFLRLVSSNSLTIEDGVDSRYPLIAAKRVGRGRGSHGFGNANDLMVAFERILDRHSTRLSKERTKAPGSSDDIQEEETPTENCEHEDKSCDPEEMVQDDKPEANDAIQQENNKDFEDGEPKIEDSDANDSEDKAPESPLLAEEEFPKVEKEDMNDNRTQDGITATIDGALETSNKQADENEDVDENDDSDDEKDAGKDDDDEDDDGDDAEEAEDDNNQPESPPPAILTMEDILGPEPTDILNHSDAWKELEKMAGLEDVKKAVRELADSAKLNYHRELAGKEPLYPSLNCMFLGPPGTGKSTVAKLYGQIVADLGFLSTNKVVITNPSDLVSSYVGESEVKMMGILNSTLGKVLIIDDAHTFYQGGERKSSHTDPCGLCLDMIVSQVHNRPGEDRCIIFAGYADIIEEMFRRANPGLRRRFPLNSAFNFEDYGDEQLNEILRQKMADEDVTAEQPAMDVAAEVLRRMRDRPNFGNGGDVQNLLDQAKARFLKRTSEDEQAGMAVLEREDFDPEWNRGAGASKRCESLFEGLIGFEAIISELQDYQRIAANMRLHGKDPRRRIPFTFVFRGASGTGKTHTARIVGHIFYDMGFLSTSEVVECSASDLISQWVGGTAPKVLELLDRALGKVLFIDEAYRLGKKSRTAGARSYEDEAIGELVDCMTKPKYFNKLVIVLAGYDQGMDALMRVNPGLRGRFPTDIMFRPMTPQQCKEYLTNLIHEDGIFIRDKDEEDEKDALLLFHKLALTPDWSNARDIKTLAGIVVSEVYRRDPEDLKVEDSPPTEVGYDARFSITTKDLVMCLDSMLRQRVRRIGAK